MATLFFWIFSIITLIQIGYIAYYLMGFQKIFHSKQSPANINTNKSATIIICGHNEAENIQKNLKSILEDISPYPQLTCVFVNDRSTDASQSLLENLQKDYNQLSIIEIDTNTAKEYPGKKDALIKGVEAVKSDYIILTDADCWIDDKDWAIRWLAWMEHYEADVGLGLGLYEREKGWVNLFTQFETLNTLMQYGTYAVNGNAYMGVGRNIAYKTSVLKNAFQEEELLNRYRATLGGDDDILVNYLQENDYVTLPYFGENQATYSKSQNNCSAYFKQKARHISVGKYYNKKTKYSLGLYALSQALWWLLLFINVIVYYNQAILILALVYFLFKTMIYKKWQYFSKHKQNSFTFVLLEIFWIAYHLYLSPYIFWKNNKQWKSS